MSGLRQGLCCLPVFLVVWSSSNFIIPYVIAVYRHDVDILFPYISATSAKPPESCIFGMMTFVTACAAFATMYARYKFVDTVLEETSLVSARLNRSSLVLGLCSCLGMSLVATFPQRTVDLVHDIGALIFFVSAIVYIFIQTVIGFRLSPYRSSLCVSWIRFSLGLLATLALIVFLILNYSPTYNRNQQDTPHIASGACEWTMVFSFVSFFLTYINEFKLFSLRVKTVYTATDY